MLRRRDTTLVRPVSQELEGRHYKHALGWVDLGYYGAGGKLIHEKNQKQKIS
jgi:hypothetical protein